MTYQRPVSSNDAKREGRQLFIRRGKKTVRLDGPQIRALKCLLRDVGEFGNRINRQRCKITDEILI